MRVRLVRWLWFHTIMARLRLPRCSWLVWAWLAWLVAAVVMAL